MALKQEHTFVHPVLESLISLLVRDHINQTCRKCDTQLTPKGWVGLFSPWSLTNLRFGSQTVVHIESMSPVSPGDEHVQDLVRDSFRLRLGRHPTGLHAGLCLYFLFHICRHNMFKTDVDHLITSIIIFHHYCNTISALNLPHREGGTHSWDHLSVSSGCHSCCVHLLLCLSDWSSVP